MPTPNILIKKYYLSLGDSNAFGVGDPEGGGYVPLLFEKLKGYGAKGYINLANSGGGDTVTFIKEHPSQLDAAEYYLGNNAGDVSPVTLSIGGNDVKGALNLDKIEKKHCEVNAGLFYALLNKAMKNLKETILPRLTEALTVNGQVTGSIVMVNYWDPYVYICGNGDTLQYVEDLNKALEEVATEFNLPIADIFTPFGGDSVPNPKLCDYTWVCDPNSPYAAHANHLGYEVIADAFAKVMGIE